MFYLVFTAKTQGASGFRQLRGDGIQVRWCAPNASRGCRRSWATALTVSPQTSKRGATRSYISHRLPESQRATLTVLVDCSELQNIAGRRRTAEQTRRHLSWAAGSMSVDHECSRRYWRRRTDEVDGVGTVRRGSDGGRAEPVERRGGWELEPGDSDGSYRIVVTDVRFLGAFPHPPLSRLAPNLSREGTTRSRSFWTRSRLTWRRFSGSHVPGVPTYFERVFTWQNVIGALPVPFGSWKVTCTNTPRTHLRRKQDALRKYSGEGFRPDITVNCLSSESILIRFDRKTRRSDEFHGGVSQPSGCNKGPMVALDAHKTHYHPTFQCVWWAMVRYAAGYSRQ